MKTCRKCNKQKPYSEFYKKVKGSKDGYAARCKECMLEYTKKYYAKTKDEQNAKAMARYYADRERILEDRKGRNRKNKEYINKKNRERYANNPVYKEKQRERAIRNRKNNPLYLIKCRVRCLVSEAHSKRYYTKKSKTFQILQIEPSEFVKYIEKQFIDGMNWENRNDWHLDHIVPMYFAQTEEQVHKLNHYSNFRPLWASENLSRQDIGIDLDIDKHTIEELVEMVLEHENNQQNKAA
jgi:hypothetical protein